MAALDIAQWVDVMVDVIAMALAAAALTVWNRILSLVSLFVFGFHFSEPFCVYLFVAHNARG